MLRMADYWLLEPPAACLMRVHWGFGKKEETISDLADQILPHHFTPFQQLPLPIRRMHMERWLRLNKGKTEKDFFKNLEEKRLARYADKLKEAREKKTDA